MSLEKIRQTIAHAGWFSQISRFHAVSGMLALASLRAWDDQVFNTGISGYEASIAVNMEWLPVSISETDPFHGNSLHTDLERRQVEFRPVLKDMSCLCMKSLRVVADDAIRSGPHNYTKTAKDAAMYCVRMATMEILADRPGRWLQLLSLYEAGYWPCGLTVICLFTDGQHCLMALHHFSKTEDALFLVLPLATSRSTYCVWYRQRHICWR